MILNRSVKYPVQNVAASWTNLKLSCRQNAKKKRKPWTSNKIILNKNENILTLSRMKSPKKSVQDILTGNASCVQEHVIQDGKITNNRFRVSINLSDHTVWSQPWSWSYKWNAWITIQTIIKAVLTEYKRDGTTHKRFSSPEPITIQPETVVQWLDRNEIAESLDITQTRL